jgi:hypothetical protein
MKKEDFFTLGWNNFLTLGLGIIMLIYVTVVVSTTVFSDLAALIGLAVIGAVY